MLPPGQSRSFRVRGRGLGAGPQGLRRSEGVCLTSTVQDQPLARRIRDVPTTQRACNFDQYCAPEDLTGPAG